jgi:2-hydroxy-3-oxopropionate reductase
MSRIGFIGLGIMGSPMAANLVRAGHEVAGHDHKQSATDRLAALGGRAAPTIAAAAEDAEIGTYALVAEAIVLMERAGVDARAGLDMLAGGLAASRILEVKRESMLAREFKPGFRIDLHHKDMGIAIAAARDAGVSLPMTGLVAQLIAAARAQGYGSLDHSALLKVVESLSGPAGPGPVEV